MDRVELTRSATTTSSSSPGTPILVLMVVVGMISALVCFDMKSLLHLYVFEL